MHTPNKTVILSDAKDFALARSKERQHRRLSCCRSAVCSLAAIAFFLLAISASAQTITGTVKNATTGKPAAGDDVILIKLAQGMEPAGSTKTDSKGNFTLKLDDSQGPHLIRVIHDGVTYHRMAPPGTTSVDVDVYDVGKKIEGIEVVADIMRVQAEQGQLEVVRMFAVQNTSKPPRTQMNEKDLEFYVPEGAQVVEGSAMTEGGQPINSMPVPETGDKTRYSFVFPLRPGTTQFQVAYQLPYTGSANVDPKPLYPLQHFVAILPKSMQFEAAPGSGYKAMNDPQQPDANVQVASGTTTGQALAFKVTGEGTLQAQQAGAGAPSDNSAAQNEDRPGGGLGPPIDAPDPLQHYRWWILGGFALALAAGGVYVASRQQAAVRAGAAGAATSPRTRSRVMEEVEDYPVPQAATRAKSEAGSAVGAGSKSAFLEGLKEEIFQLEVDHKQGTISQQEYEKTKAALDQTLQRALKREAAKQT